MDSIWNANALVIFLAFFIPGFIMKKVYGLFVATDDDWSKLLPEVVAFSALHYVAFGWIILQTWNGPCRWFWVIVVVLVLPVIWAPLWLLLRDPKKWGPRILSRGILSYMLAPEATPWDRMFDDPREVWIIAKTKTGGHVGGLMKKGSATSAFPAPDQIYVTNPWECDEHGFIAPVPNSSGLLVEGSEIEYLYLFNTKEETT